MADAMPKGIRQGTLLWKMFYGVSRPFVSKQMVAHDTRGRTREQIAVDVTNKSVGPMASVDSRESALGTLATAVILVPFAAFLVVVAISVVLRPSIGNIAAGNLAAIAGALMFPVVGLCLPLSWRWWRARRDLRSWQSRGEPADEHPSDASLPGAADILIGVLLGGTLSVMLVVGMITS